MLYMCEFCPTKFANVVATIWNCLEGFEYIWMTLYFMTGHKNCQVFVWVGNIYFFVTLFGLILIPESPKWLLEKKKF